jgi:hypothetical protein
MIDQEAVDWKIETIRNAIASDWAELGHKGLNVRTEEGNPRTPSNAP